MPTRRGQMRPIRPRPTIFTRKRRSVPPLYTSLTSTAGITDATTGGQCAANAAEPHTDPPHHTHEETAERFPPPTSLTSTAGITGTITGGQCAAIAAEPQTNPPHHTNEETAERFPHANNRPTIKPIITQKAPCKSKAELKAVLLL